MTSSSSDDLPHHTSPHLQLLIATPAENAAQTVSNSVEWRGPLTQEVYLRREAHLATQDLTRDGRLTAWLLIDTTSASGKGRILCGCETIRKRALTKVDDGSVREVVCYGVASVFCSEELRGRGYAGRMIEELGKRLEGNLDLPTLQESERPLFSVLFSDIGRKFYAARGWRAYPSTHIALPAASAPDDSTSSAAPSNLPPVRLLSTADLPSLCARDEVLIRTRLAHTKSQTHQNPAIAIIPDHATIAWHHARENFFARELDGRESPEFKGGLVHLQTPNASPQGTTGDSFGGGGKIWCYWNRVWTEHNDDKDPNTLYILRLTADDEKVMNKVLVEEEGDAADDVVVEAVAALLHAARVQAREWGMKKVCMWSPSGVSVAAARRLMLQESGQDAADAIRIITRENDSITSLRWFGEGGAEREVEWWCNEKFQWC
ncbi:uncharacterized protein K489DRAFT_359591 [Dissoconium aciculare CBS 342.82]|uniref:LYC1 C-terminal domain-containing protein n=1 Tax=Dissoconium aciculare CBS 342.82 TaxID=1314786 RepID=A0A6J3M133_9PEZI|nr:uncharacterized protein K489DRAFT_359591 [Dissoconium aciculare CBS 342.82]KAF1821745.1 hypothetical protein K489DRAFT_359591 [Dissoconium aciculare CBS 342.82]